MIIILLSFTASEPACHLDCEVSISWSQPAAVMRDVLALQILTITSLFLDNTNPRTKVKMSSDKTVQWQAVLQWLEGPVGVDNVLIYSRPAQGWHPCWSRQQTWQMLGEIRQFHLIYFQTTTSRSFLLTNINYSDYWITLGLGTWTVSISSEYFSLDVLNHLCEVVV